jgi:hypothetical protein
MTMREGVGTDQYHPLPYTTGRTANEWTSRVSLKHDISPTKNIQWPLFHLLQTSSTFSNVIIHEPTHQPGPVVGSNSIQNGLHSSIVTFTEHLVSDHSCINTAAMTL